jgi:hypothetical protein
MAKAAAGRSYGLGRGPVEACGGRGGWRRRAEGRGGGVQREVEGGARQIKRWGERHHQN